MTRRFRALLLLLLASFAVHAATPESEVPPPARRGPEQTLLTFPEWYLVHSPAEYARTVQAQPAHAFPFLSQIGQLWSGYGVVTAEQLRRDESLNPGYHVMIWVIATSTTVEYTLRSAYENTVGRVSWWLGGSQLTDEDRYGAVAAQDYVDFIRQQPWYMFDFSARLRHLWSDVPMRGHGIVRKWERRYALTSEYLVKAAYGKLIEWATRAAYDPAAMSTDVVVQSLPAHTTLPARTSVVRALPDGRTLLALPRYFDFRIAATALATQGVRIVDVAGNGPDADILVTVWLADGRDVPAGSGRVLFEQTISLPAHTRRVALLMPVAHVSDFLAQASATGMTVEHVYDY